MPAGTPVFHLFAVNLSGRTIYAWVRTPVPRRPLHRLTCATKDSHGSLFQADSPLEASHLPVTFPGSDHVINANNLTPESHELCRSFGSLGKFTLGGRDHMHVLTDIVSPKRPNSEAQRQISCGSGAKLSGLISLSLPGKVTGRWLASKVGSAWKSERLVAFVSACKPVQGSPCSKQHKAPIPSC